MAVRNRLCGSAVPNPGVNRVDTGRIVALQVLLTRLRAGCEVLDRYGMSQALATLNQTIAEVEKELERLNGPGGSG